MLLQPADHGRIHTWWGGTLLWGEDGNDRRNIYLQTWNFSDFIGQMFENEAGDAYAC